MEQILVQFVFGNFPRHMPKVVTLHPDLESHDPAVVVSSSKPPVAD